MGTKKQVKKIKKNSFKMGNQMFKKFEKNGGTKTLKASCRAYNITLRAIKYGILYGKKS